MKPPAWRAFAADESGTAIVEYALVLSLVSVLSIGVLLALGTALEAFFGTSSTGLSNVGTQAK